MRNREVPDPSGGFSPFRRENGVWHVPCNDSIMQELFSETIRERWQAFWNRTHATIPLVGFRVEDLLDPSCSAYRTRSGVDAEEWFLQSVLNGSLAEAVCRQVELHRAVDQDSVSAADPCSWFPWAESIAGCRSPSGGVEWNAPPMEDGSMEQHGDSVPDTVNSWERALAVLHSGLRIHSHGKFRIASLQVAGPTDVTVRTIPAKDLSRGLSRSPDAVRTFADRQADLIGSLILQQAGFAFPEAGEGVIGPYGIWSDRRIASLRERESACVSLRDYEKCFLPALAGIAEATGACIVELDTASLHILDLLLDLPEVCALVVQRRPEGPSLPDMLPAFRRIQDCGRCLVIAGPLDTEDIDQVLDRLARDGLFLSLQVERSGETALWMNYIRRRCGIPVDGELRAKLTQ